MKLKEKSYYPALLGAVSLLLFGLILANGIQAVFILIESPVSQFLKSLPIILCIFAGVIQGGCEEGGYYFIFFHQLKGRKSWWVPILFAIGRAGLHFIFDIIEIVSSNHTIQEIGISILVLIVFIGALFGLTIMDYAASRWKRLRWLCGLSIMLHAIVNGVIYAPEINLITLTTAQLNILKIIFTAIIMIISFMIYKRVGKET